METESIQFFVATIVFFQKSLGRVLSDACQIVCHSNFFGHAEKVSKKLKFNAAKFFASKEDGLNVIQNIQNIQNLKEDAAVLIH